MFRKSNVLERLSPQKPLLVAWTRGTLWYRWSKMAKYETFHVARCIKTLELLLGEISKVNIFRTSKFFILWVFIKERYLWMNSVLASGWAYLSYLQLPTTVTEYMLTQLCYSSKRAFSMNIIFLHISMFQEWDSDFICHFLFHKIQATVSLCPPASKKKDGGRCQVHQVKMWL